MRALVKHLGLPFLTSLEGLPGFTTFSPVLRQAARDLMVIKDDGSIPTGLSFDYQDTCWLKHYGLCGHRDAGILRLARRIGTRLHTSLVDGNCYKLTAARKHNAPVLPYVFVAFKRGRDPTLSVYCCCKLDRDTGDLLMGITGGQFRFATHMQPAKHFLVDTITETSAPRRLQSLSFARVSYTNITGRFLRVKPTSYGEEDILFSRTRTKKPKVVDHSADDCDRDNVFAQGFAGLFGSARPSVSRSVRPDGSVGRTAPSALSLVQSTSLVECAPPQASDSEPEHTDAACDRTAGDHDGSDSEPDPEDLVVGDGSVVVEPVAEPWVHAPSCGAASSSGNVPPPPPAHHVSHRRAAAKTVVAPRKERSVPWGPDRPGFSLALIVPSGLPDSAATGMGANCFFAL